MAKALMNVNENTIDWREGRIPVSTQYEDVYFSVDDGLAETQYVFIEGNRISQRFSSLDNFQPFVIAETGFGTGLNFLATWQLFDRSECQGLLEYISVEKYPLRKNDLKQALGNFPELKQYSERLIAIWEYLYTGVHRIKISSRIYLTLHIGDVQDTFLHTPYEVDAWYLDGFAPSKNPDMWTPQLFKGMAAHSHCNTTFATFTAAGIVKRGLVEVGFLARKAKGFGRKRDMLVGHYGDDVQLFHVKPEWFDRHTSSNATIPRNILVVGSGLAGANAARALADYGRQVTVIEKENKIANKASGNLFGLSKPPVKLGVDTPLYEFGESGFLHGLNQSSKLKGMYSRGVFSLWSKSLDKEKTEAFFDRRTFDRSYLAMKDDGLDSKIGMVVSPRDYIKELLNHDLIDVRVGVELSEIDQSAFDVIVMANGVDLQKIIPQIRPVRGQVSYLPSVDNADWPAYSYGGYSIFADDITLVGATFDHNDEVPELRELDHEYNLSEFNKAFDDQKTLSDVKGGRVSWRATTPDHLPLVGPVYSRIDFFDQYASQLKGGKQSCIKDEGISPLVYVIGGLGSHGLNYASLSADILLHYLLGSPAPVASRLLKATHPMRFFVRQIQKNQVSRETLQGEKR